MIVVWSRWPNRNLPEPRDYRPDSDKKKKPRPKGSRLRSMQQNHRHHPVALFVRAYKNSLLIDFDQKFIVLADVQTALFIILGNAHRQDFVRDEK